MNEILQPIRFYDSTSKMLVKRHEKLGYKNIVPVIADHETLLPFMLYCSKTNVTPNPITTFEAVNYKTSVAYNLLSTMTFSFALDNSLTPTKLYVFYDGASVNTALNQGIYYLHIVSTDHTWYSGLFKVGYYTQVCTIEWSNAKSFSNLWIPTDKFYKAVYEAYTYDPGEYNEYAESNKQEDSFDIFTYRRADKLRVVALLGDSDAMDCLKVAQMCDTVYITDELGNRNSVEIMEVSATGVGQSNYMTINLKYRIKENSIITVDETPATVLFTQEGSKIVTPPAGTGMTFGGGGLEFGGEPVKFGT